MLTCRCQRLAVPLLILLSAGSLGGCTWRDLVPQRREGPAKAVQPDTARPEAEQAVERLENAAAPAARLEGPWHMQCFVEDEIVLDVPEVYRTRRATQHGSWIYVTADGTVVKGRITAGANCVWLREPEGPPIPDPRPGEG